MSFCSKYSTNIRLTRVANGQAWKNHANLNYSSLVGNVPPGQSENLSGGNGNPSVQPPDLSESVARMLRSKPGQRLQEQFYTPGEQSMSGSLHIRQQVSQMKPQAPRPTQNNRNVATRAAKSHHQLFPNMKAEAFDPSAPLRLETSTGSKMDLTGARVLNPGEMSQLPEDPRLLGGLFSNTIDSRNGVTGKSLESGRPQRRGASSGEVKAQSQKLSTFKQLNENYQKKITEEERKIAQAQRLPSRADKGQDRSGSRSSGVSGGRVTKRQASKPTRKPSSGSGSPKIVHHAPGSGVGATPCSRRDEEQMDAAALKAVNYAFHLGRLSAAKDTTQGNTGVPKETMSLKDLEKLMESVPEFFKNHEEPSQESPNSESDFRPPPPPPPDLAAATTADEITVPMVDGSGSAQRIPSADTIQGLMEKAMNGQAPTLPTPSRAQVAPVDSVASNQQPAQNGVLSPFSSNMGLPHQPDQSGAAPGTTDPGMALPPNKHQPGGARCSPDGCNGPPCGSSSPFQINGGRAHIDQETLRQQTKATGTKITEPKHGRKRAASGVSGAGDQETENKPKRKRTYKKKNVATATATAVDQEQAAAVTDRLDTSPSTGTLPVNTELSSTAAENSMDSSSPTIARVAVTKTPMPMDELEAWIWSAPPTGKPYTEEQRAELDFLFAKTAARINSISGRAENPIDLTEIDAL